MRLNIWILVNLDHIMKMIHNMAPQSNFALTSPMNIQLISTINTANICWSSRCLQDMSWRRLQHVFSVTILRLPRRLEDVLEDEKLLRWRRLEDVLKTCLEDVLKTCLEDACKTSWRQTKCFLKLSVSNKSKCVSNKSGISQIYIWRI